jgi:hypothetical protein
MRHLATSLATGQKATAIAWLERKYYSSQYSCEFGQVFGVGETFGADAARKGVHSPMVGRLSRSMPRELTHNRRRGA